MKTVLFILIVAFLLAICLKDRKIKTIEQCNNFLCKCRDPKKYMQVLRKRANLYEEQENYSAAVDDYIKVMDYFSKLNDSVMINVLFEDIIVCYEKLKQYNQIVTWCSKMIQNGIDDVDFITYTRRANAYKELGDESEAQADFKKAIELMTEEMESDKDSISNWLVEGFDNYYLERSKCYSNLGMYNNALEDADNAIKVFKEYIAKEYAFLLNDKTEKCTDDDILQNNEDEKSSAIELFEQLLDIQVKCEKFDEALKTCKKLIWLDSENQMYVDKQAEIKEKLKN